MLTYISEFDDASLADALSDPGKNCLVAIQITTNNSKGFAAAVVHQLVANAVAEDHGGVAGKFAIEEIRDGILLGFVEDRDGWFSIDAFDESQRTVNQ